MPSSDAPAPVAHAEVAGSASPFHFSAGSFADGALRVTRFHGQERASEVYEIDVGIAVAPDQPPVDATLLGATARLDIEVPGGSPRSIRGIVAWVEVERGLAQGLLAYRIDLVPRLWRLYRRRRSRIFQDQTIVTVVDQILAEHAIERRWSLTRTYPSRAYCVQYRETDLEFMQRILAEAGVFFWFDVGAAETVVFSDGGMLYPDLAGSPDLLYYRHVDDEGGTSGGGLRLREDFVHRFALRRALKHDTVVTHDHDFRRPLLDLTDAVGSAEAAPARARVLEPGTASAASSLLGPEKRPFYEHHGDYDEPAEGGGAAVLLEQVRRRALVARGASGCRRLTPGAVFALHNHDVEDLNRRYVVVAVKHEGVAPTGARTGEPIYRNRFTAVPAEVPMRPRVPARRIVQTLETATVVGPRDHEIHTDVFGRIRVQLHWDPDGKRDEHSSCWVRVSQAWAGSNWGFQFIPRVGMEVLVSYLGGDPDRPVVTGCLYDATHPPTHQLPERQTYSGIRTQSSPGGQGYNELLFDDTKGAERLSLRAQHNLEETVLHDQRTAVGGDRSLNVSGRREIDITGDDALTVSGSLKTVVRGGASTSVGGGGSSVYAGDRSASVAGDDVTRIGGGHAIAVGKFSHLIVGHGEKEGGHALVSVNGNYRVGAAEELVLSGVKRVRISCGESFLEIGPDEIKLSAKTITLAAETDISCAGGKTDLRLGERVEIKGDEIGLFSKRASVVMDEEAKIDGKRVLLNCGPREIDASAEKAPPEKGTITFKIEPHVDTSDGEPLTLVVAGPDGKLIEAPVPPSNVVQIEGNKGDRYVMVDIRKGKQSLTQKPG